MHDATLFGASIHALVADSLPDSALLRQAGVSADEAEVREIAPSLEDVFVTLTTAADAADADTSPARQAHPAPH